MTLGCSDCGRRHHSATLTDFSHLSECKSENISATQTYVPLQDGIYSFLFWFGPHWYVGLRCVYITCWED